MSRHPMQPIVREGTVIRFRANQIILDLLSGTVTPDLNVIMARPYKKADKEQLAQLMGYSVSGFADLSYASPRMIQRADEATLELMRSETEARKPS